VPDSPDLPDRPYSRQDFAGALVANAAAKPFNLALLLIVVGGGLAVGAPLPLALVVGLLVYLAAAARTFFDDEEADRVLASERAQRRAQVEEGRTRLDPATLAPPIGRRLREARSTEARIRDAIDRAELPYAEVSGEVDALVGLMEQSARRAQLLHEALDETPPQRIARRLAELQGSGKTELIDALEHQLAVQNKVATQLERFYDEMERVVVELDTVRGTLVSVSASTDAANQQRLAADVRGLRDELGTLASGMSEAYEAQADASSEQQP
jgi:hypothetical protein